MSVGFQANRYWRCLSCNFPEAGAKPEKCPKCGSTVLFGFDNETNFMFRRAKWDDKARRAARQNPNPQRKR